MTYENEVNLKLLQCDVYKKGSDFQESTLDDIGLIINFNNERRDKNGKEYVK